MKTLPRVGDRVILPWGQTEVEGSVVRVNENPKQPYVTVDVLLEGTDEPLRVIYPVDLVEPARAA